MLMQKMMGQPVSPPATSFGTAPASVPKGSSNHALRTVGAVQVQEDEEGEEAVAEEEYDARQLTRQRALEEGRRKYMRPAPAPQQGQPHRDHAAHEPSPLSTHQHGDDDISPMPSPPPSFSAPRTSKIQRSALPLSDDRAAGGEIGDAGVARATDEATGRSLNRITIADRGISRAMRSCMCVCVCACEHACLSLNCPPHRASREPTHSVAITHSIAHAHDAQA